MKFDDGDLRVGADAERHGAAQADVDVEGLVAVVVSAVGVLEGEACGRPAEEFHLCGVGVPGEGQRDVGGGHHLVGPVCGVVREEYAEAVGTLQRRRQVAVVMVRKPSLA